MMTRILLTLLLLAGSALPLAAQAPARAPTPTLDAIRARGVLNCAVNGALPGFSVPDQRGIQAAIDAGLAPANAQGPMMGFDADLCRAVAAALFGDATKVRFVTAATVADGFAALRENRADLLLRNTTFTYLRDLTEGADAAAVVMFDGQGLLVPLAGGAQNLAQLGGRRICISGDAGTVAQEVLESQAARQGITVTIVPTGGPGLITALEEGRCDAASADAKALAIRRVMELQNPAGYRVLPDLLSREPLAAFVREGADDIRQVVFWVIQAMLEADEYDLTSENLVDFLQNNDPAVRRLLGIDGNLGTALGLGPDWSRDVLAQVGAYREVFSRSLGPLSPYGLDIGANDNWLRGGLMFPRVLR
jgi:general L-amino acid transport system substrate-binding protein